MTQTPTLADMVRVYGRIGLLSFGGPAAQISLMHKELVEDRPWMEEKQFLGALSFCMLLPGPEAMQLATYSGWKLRGWPGGLIAGLLFVLPGAAVIFLLAALYVRFGPLPLVQDGFLGVKAAVVAIILTALVKLWKKVLHGWPNRLIALFSLAALFTGALPFPLVILIAGLAGAVMGGRDDQHATPAHRASWRSTVGTVLFWGALWALPVAYVALSGHSFLLQIATFFSTLAVVTFGGAYAVLAYMVQTVASDHGWLTTAQMMDALGLAETTPGPLILVTQFVATLAGQAQGGAGLALVAGVLALWCTFVPCFLWVFAGAPHVEILLAQPRLRAALDRISAAVVGVIANLSLWFAIHLLFARTQMTALGPVPDWATLDPRALVLVGAALAGGFLVRLSMIRLLGLMLGLGLLAGLL
nr:chromate efflux transporter [Shimia biformata]